MRFIRVLHFTASEHILQDRAQENFHFEQFRQSYPKKREANAEKYFCVTTCNVRCFFVGCKKKPKEGTENGMRVITGSARGRRLNELKVMIPARPWIRSRRAFSPPSSLKWRGRALDLFAGSGQLGIEALSRGAQRAVFVDNAPSGRRHPREPGAHAAGRSATVAGICGDWMKTCRPAVRSDLLDPPYAEVFWKLP